MSDKVKNILLAIIPVIIVGGLCSYITRTGVAGWYAQMAKSSLTPPNYVFSVAWSIIYILLMISFYRLLSHVSTEKASAYRFYWQQLILQVLWCFLFFKAKLPLIGGLVILWLVITVFRMILAFLKIDKTAGFLNIFYLLYICFASFLNWSFLYRNALITTF
ncbi:MAG: tryptophan-rich sensory protein [Alphaproteobacteria bacterium]|nr:tryptophan-rich sensory protein [Alphaproteobacteria bacterium]